MEGEMEGREGGKKFVEGASRMRDGRKEGKMFVEGVSGRRGGRKG